MVANDEFVILSFFLHWVAVFTTIDLWVFLFCFLAQYIIIYLSQSLWCSKFILWRVSLSQIQHPFDMASFFCVCDHFLPFMEQSILNSFYPLLLLSPRISHPQRTLVPFIGEWYLEMKLFFSPPALPRNQDLATRSAHWCWSAIASRLFEWLELE